MLMLLMILSTCSADKLPTEIVRMPKQFGDLTMKQPDSSFYSTLFPKYFIIQVIVTYIYYSIVILFKK